MCQETFYGVCLKLEAISFSTLFKMGEAEWQIEAS
jgi:hypothetical protein